MAQPQASYPPASLLGIPLEVRHLILELASTRDYKPKKVFRKWFEKNDVKDQIAKLKVNSPNGVAPLVSHGEQAETESDGDVSVDHEEGDFTDVEDEDEEGEEDNVDEDEEDDLVDEDEEDDLVDEEGMDQIAQVDAELEEEMNGVEVNNMLHSHGTAADVGATTMPIAGPSTPAVNATGSTLAAEPEVDVDMSEHPGVDEFFDANDEVGGDEGDDVQTGEADNAQDNDAQNEEEENVAGQAQVAVIAAAGTASANQPAIWPNSKWRHVPKLVRITQCPPPTNLFLICKQLSAEAKEWFYNVAVLKIYATASFAHHSFFEIVLSSIADAAYSPMENIRKAEVTFVWDSTWIRAQSADSPACVFSFFLQNRAEYVLGILQRAPDLQEVLIHWHDSADDQEAQDLMQDVLEKFVCHLNATVHTKVHIIPTDVKPHSKSIAGRLRLEFQDMVDNPREAY